MLFAFSLSEVERVCSSKCVRNGEARSHSLNISGVAGARAKKAPRHLAISHNNGFPKRSMLGRKSIYVEVWRAVEQLGNVLESGSSRNTSSLYPNSRASFIPSLRVL